MCGVKLWARRLLFPTRLVRGPGGRETSMQTSWSSGRTPVRVLFEYGHSWILKKLPRSGGHPPHSPHFRSASPLHRSQGMTRTPPFYLVQPWGRDRYRSPSQRPDPACVANCSTRRRTFDNPRNIAASSCLTSGLRRPPRSASHRRAARRVRLRLCRGQQTSSLSDSRHFQPKTVTPAPAAPSRAPCISARTSDHRQSRSSTAAVGRAHRRR